MANSNTSEDIRHQVHIRHIQKITQSPSQLDLENMKKSFLTLKRYTQHGQKVLHNTGFSLQTVQAGNQFRHVLRIESDALQACFRAEGIPLDQIEMTQMYDIETATLDHDDVLEYVSELSRIHGEEMQMTALYCKSEWKNRESCHLIEVTLQFQVSALEILNDKRIADQPCNGMALAIDTIPLQESNAERCPSRLLHWRSQIIVEPHHGRFYEEHTNHIQSALNNNYIIALPNGRLGVGPLVHPNRAIFVRRAYAGFTSEVPPQYKVFPNMQRVNVHLFHHNQDAETSYISKGCGNEVILSRRKRPINNASLSESDPRFFYRIDLEKTVFTVFMNTSRPNHYLAVAANGKDLQLEHIEKSDELLVGHTNAKFKII